MFKSKLMAEFIGTFALVFFGCGGLFAAHTGATPGGAVPLLFGGTITIMIYALGHISGGHFNPAVTGAFALVKRFPRSQLVPYWLCQVGGALLACLVLRILGVGLEPGVTHLSVTTGAGFLWEVMLTFFLMFVIISVATDARAVGMMAGLAIGLTIILDAFLAGGYTGASMNPARSIAPAVFTGDFTNLWIYIVAPLLGAALAACCYEAIRDDVRAPNRS